MTKGKETAYQEMGGGKKVVSGFLELMGDFTPFLIFHFLFSGPSALGWVDGVKGGTGGNFCIGA